MPHQGIISSRPAAVTSNGGIRGANNPDNRFVPHKAVVRPAALSPGRGLRGGAASLRRKK